MSRSMSLYSPTQLSLITTHTLHSLFYSMHAAHFRRPSHMSDNSYSARSLADSLANYNETAYSCDNSHFRSPSGFADGCLIFSLLHSYGVPVTTGNLCALVDALLHVRFNLIKGSVALTVKEGGQTVSWESVIGYISDEGERDRLVTLLSLFKTLDAAVKEDGSFTIPVNSPDRGLGRSTLIFFSVFARASVVLTNGSGTELFVCSPGSGKFPPVTLALPSGGHYLFLRPPFPSSLTKSPTDQLAHHSMSKEVATSVGNDAPGTLAISEKHSAQLASSRPSSGFSPFLQQQQRQRLHSPSRDEKKSSAPQTSAATPLQHVTGTVSTTVPSYHLGSDEATVPQVSALVFSDAPSFPPDLGAEGAVKSVNRNKRRNKRKKKRKAGIKAKQAAKKVDEQFLEDAWVKAVTDDCMRFNAFLYTPSSPDPCDPACGHPSVTADMPRVAMTVEYSLGSAWCSADISTAGGMFKVRD